MLKLRFPQAFLNQEITSHFWHLQEVRESSGDRFSGVCTFLAVCFPGCSTDQVRVQRRQKLHGKDRGCCPWIWGGYLSFFFRVNLLFLDAFASDTKNVTSESKPSLSSPLRRLVREEGRWGACVAVGSESEGVGYRKI